MKLSHRDFRPNRRSRFVTRPPSRRPTIRVLLLGLLGLVVYLKFDTVAKTVQGFRPGRWWDSVRNSPAASGTSMLPLAQSWSPDSQSVLLVCPTLPDSCLGPGFPLGPEAAGLARATLAKASLNLDGDASLGFRAGFRKRDPGLGGAAGWDLEKLELQGRTGNTSLTRADGNPDAPLCAGTRCLESAMPQSPLTGFLLARVGTDSPRVRHIRLLPGRTSAVRPLLRGRVVSVPPAGDDSSWLRIHHGRDLYSLYRGFARVSAGMRPGAMVETGDTLGWVGPREDSLAGLDLRVESFGAAMDATAFLGIPDTIPEVAHAQ